MKHVFIGIILGLAATAAFASGNNNQNNSDNSSATATATVGNVTANGGTHTQTIGNVTGGAGGSASATGVSVGGIGNSVLSPKAEANSVNTNVVGQDQKQGQIQGQQQGQGQGQKQSTSVKNAGNNTGTATVVISSPVTFNAPKLAAGASAPAMNTTATCRIAIAGGLQIPTLGISGGGSVEDKKCSDRELARMLIETARIAHSMGANPEYFAELFEKGVALMVSTATEEEPLGKSIAPVSVTESLNP